MNLANCFLYYFLSEYLKYKGYFINLEFEINIHTHTTICKIDNQEDLLYSTGNAVQYFVITYMGKELEKNGHT